MTEAKPKKRRSQPTRELFKQVLDKLERLDSRIGGLEVQQTLTNSAWQRQGKLLEEINLRCMDKLGLKCPLVADEEEQADTKES